MHNIACFVMMITLSQTELCRLENALEVSILQSSEVGVPGFDHISYSIKYSDHNGLPDAIVLYRHSQTNDFAAPIGGNNKDSNVLSKSPNALPIHPGYDFALGRLVDTKCRTCRLVKNQQTNGHVLVDRANLPEASIVVEFLVDAETYDCPNYGVFLIQHQDKLSTGFGTSKFVYRVRKHVPLPSSR